MYYRTLLRLGLPIVIGQFGVIVLGFADTIMVGHYGTDELGAAGFVNNLFNLVIIFATGFSYGLTPLVGKYFGRGERDSIGQILRNGLLANVLTALLMTFVMWCVYLNLEHLGQPRELLPLIRPYFLVLLVSLVFVGAFNAFKQFADGIGDTGVPMWIMLGGNALNIFGNWVLIYGKLGFEEMGLLGAGISTLFSRIMMFVAIAAMFMFSRRYAPYRAAFAKGCLNRKDFLSINKLGWPVGLQMGMETASFSLATIMVGWLGTNALAAHQIMLTIGQLGFMMYYGMAAAVSVRTSHFYGQNDIPNIRRNASAGFHIILCMAFAVSVLIFLFRSSIGELFTDNARVSMLVVQLVVPFVLYQFGDGMQCNYSNALRGMADVKAVMYSAFVAYFLISLPAGYLFGFVFKWELTGIWLSFPFGLTSAGIMYYLRFRHCCRVVKTE